MQEHGPCKLQGSVGRTSLQIEMHNFVRTRCDLLATEKYKKSNVHLQKLRYEVLSSQRRYIIGITTKDYCYCILYGILQV